MHRFPGPRPAGRSARLHGPGMAAALLAFALATPALADPVTFVVDGSHTYPRFSYSHLGLSTQLSRFDNTTGTVVLDQAARTASVDITIDMTSVDTGHAEFNEHIQAEDFLDTARHPTATFRSTRVNFEGDQPVSIEGKLTIKGITKPVTLGVTRFARMEHPLRKKDAIGADASVVIKRSDFNAGKYAPLVGDEVTISIALEAVAE
jgi:polyisoprenoid-binding protein YceI